MNNKFTKFLAAGFAGAATLFTVETVGIAAINSYRDMYHFAELHKTYREVWSARNHESFAEKFKQYQHAYNNSPKHYGLIKKSNDGGTQLSLLPHTTDESLANSFPKPEDLLTVIKKINYATSFGDIPAHNSKHKPRF